MIQHRFIAWGNENLFTSFRTPPPLEEIYANCKLSFPPFWSHDQDDARNQGPVYARATHRAPLTFPPETFNYRGGSITKREIHIARHRCIHMSDGEHASQKILPTCTRETERGRERERNKKKKKVTRCRLFDAGFRCCWSEKLWMAFNNDTYSVKVNFSSSQVYWFTVCFFILTVRKSSKNKISFFE